MMQSAADGLATALLMTLAMLAICGAMLHESWKPARSGWVRVSSSLVALLVLALSAAPAVRTVVPGSPFAEGDVAGLGEHVPLPPSAAGRVVVVVKGRLQPDGAQTARFALAGADKVVEGTLERTHVRTRQKRAHFWHERLVFQQRATLAPGALELKLEQLRGGLDGPLHVEVYRDEWPVPVLLPLAGLVLLAAAVLHARLGLRRYATLAGTALAFGLFVDMWGEPGASLEFAAATLFLALTLGGPAGWLSARAFQRRQPPPTPAPRRK